MSALDQKTEYIPVYPTEAELPSENGNDTVIPLYSYLSSYEKAWEFDVRDVLVLFKKDPTFYVGSTWFEINGRKHEAQQVCHRVQGVIVEGLHSGTDVIVKNEATFDRSSSMNRWSLHCYSGKVFSYSHKGLSGVLCYELRVDSEKLPPLPVSWPQEEMGLQQVEVQLLSEPVYTSASKMGFKSYIDGSFSITFKAKIIGHTLLDNLEVIVTRVFDVPLRNPSTIQGLICSAACVVSGVLEPIFEEGTSFVMFTRITASEIMFRNMQL